MMSFSDRSLADEVTTNNDDIMFLWQSLNMIVGRLSRLWIIFAKIAWELLTNKWVYWEVIWLDVLLRKYWNVVKNFANFWLWFYFVYVIFKWLISTWKDSIEKALKNTLLWILIAWIWIQASRFLTAAVIDLSTIAMSAAGSLPSMVISNSPYVWWAVEQSIRSTFAMEWNQLMRAKLIEVGEWLKKWKFVEFVRDNAPELETPQTMEALVDVLQPQPDDVSWPLYFIWFSILDIKDITTINTTSENRIKATILNTIIQWWATIIYGVEMAVLCIVAIMRVLYLWMFIMISPMAILLRCIQQSWEKLWWSSKGFLSGFMTQLNFETFLINVFKPAIVVLWLWVAAIFAWLMSNIVTNTRSNNSDGFEYKWVTFSSQANTGTNTGGPGEITYTSTMEHNLFRVSLENVWKTFLELVLAILTVILVYQIIKVAMTMWNWKDFVWKRISSIQDSVWKVLWSTPIIPVTWYDKEWAKTTRYIWANKVFGLGEESLLERKIRWYENKIRETTDKDTNIIRSWFSEDTPWVLSAKDKTAIQDTMKDTTAPWQNLQKTKSIIDRIRKADRQNKWTWMTLSGSVNNFWRNEFENWLTLMKDNEREITSGNWFGNDTEIWKSMITRWKNAGDGNKTLEKLFTATDATYREEQRVQAYLRFFFPDTYADEISKKRTRRDLMNLDISKNNPRSGDTKQKDWGDDNKGETKNSNLWSNTWWETPASWWGEGTPPAP